MIEKTYATGEMTIHHVLHLQFCQGEACTLGEQQGSTHLTIGCLQVIYKGQPKRAACGAQLPTRN